MQIEFIFDQIQIIFQFWKNRNRNNVINIWYILVEPNCLLAHVCNASSIHLYYSWMGDTNHPSSQQHNRLKEQKTFYFLPSIHSTSEMYLIIKQPLENDLWRAWNFTNCNFLLLWMKYVLIMLVRKLEDTYFEYLHIKYLLIMIFLFLFFQNFEVRFEFDQR